MFWLVLFWNHQLNSYLTHTHTHTLIYTPDRDIETPRPDTYNTDIQGSTRIVTTWIVHMYMYCPLVWKIITCQWRSQKYSSTEATGFACSKICSLIIHNWRNFTRAVRAADRFRWRVRGAHGRSFLLARNYGLDSGYTNTKLIIAQHSLQTRRKVRHQQNMQNY